MVSLLLFQLLACFLVHSASSAWLSAVPSLKKNEGQQGATTRIVSRRQLDPSSVNEFVQGLDSVLGNPTSGGGAISAAVDAVSDVVATTDTIKSVDMAVPNSAVLVGGGIATLSIGGLALIMQQQMGSENNEDKNSGSDDLKQRNLQMQGVERGVAFKQQASANSPPATPKQQGGEGDKKEGKQQQLEPEALLLAELQNEKRLRQETQAELSAVSKANSNLWNKYKEQQGLKQETAAANEELVEKLDTATNEVSGKQKELAQAQEQLESANKEISGKEIQLQQAQTRFEEQLQEQLVTANQDIASKQGQLQNEMRLRQETQAELSAVSKANSNLWRKYKEEQSQLQQTTQELTLTQTELEELQQSSKAELAAIAEANRVLEDQYELEQNQRQQTQTELQQTQEELQTTQRKLVKTQGELSQTQQTLTSTEAQLQSTTNTVSDLQAENRSLRTLSTKIWRVSKDRVRNRFQKVRSRFRRNRD